MNKSVVKQVIVLRYKYLDKEGKLFKPRLGKMCAQAAHASLKVFFDRANVKNYPSTIPELNIKILQIPIDNDMYEWIKGLFTKICVGVNSEQELLDIHLKAMIAKLPVALIKDAGKTEFKEPTFTCLAIGPAKSELIDKITGDLKLL